MTHIKGLQGRAMLPACTRPCVGIRRAAAVVSAKKGFGDATEEARKADAAQIKKSKRGKVASRPSQQKQLERLQREEEEYLAALKARTSSQSTADTAPSAPADIGNDDDDYASSSVTVPEQITDRMLKRMLLFSGGPVMVGMLLFPLFYYLKKVQGIDLPVWVVYIVQTTIFGGGLLGISYGVISSSWDPSREGSLLGWNEFKANLPLVLDRFRKKE